MKEGQAGERVRLKQIVSLMTLGSLHSTKQSHTNKNGRDLDMREGKEPWSMTIEGGSPDSLGTFDNQVGQECWYARGDPIRKKQEGLRESI